MYEKNPMFINRIAFLTMLSQKLQMATVEHIPLLTASQLSNSIMKIVKLYARTGFIVRLVVMMDQEFDKVENIVHMVQINTTAAHKHVGEIKCNIRVIMERSCAIVSNLHYKILPRQVVIHLVYFSLLWLNSLPSAVGVLEKYPPCNIVIGCELNFNKHCKTTFASYVKAHEDPVVTNTMQARTFPSIFLGPTSNLQGTHKVFDINTGVVKKLCAITPLPMPDCIIKVVKDWGRRNQQLERSSILKFLNCQ
jgi:hypothetical protein